MWSRIEYDMNKLILSKPVVSSQSISLPDRKDPNNKFFRTKTNFEWFHFFNMVYDNIRVLSESKSFNTSSASEKMFMGMAILKLVTVLKFI